MRRRSFSLACLALLASACTKAPSRSPLRGPEGTKPSGTPSPLVLTADLDRKAIAPEASADLVARLRVTAEPRTSANRPPMHLALVIDTSGSMQGDAIAEAREATSTLLDGLRKGDTVTIVTFDSKAELLVPTVTLGEGGPSGARELVAKMEARGTTDLAGGLQLALQQVGSTVAQGIVTRLVLLSDGVPNDAAAIPGLAQNAKAMGIAITSLGFGLEYDETLLAQLAQNTGGRFHRIAEGERIATAFADEVFRIDSVAASAVSLQLRAGPGVQIQRVLGHDFSSGAGTSAITLSDLSAGQSQEVFVELTASGHRDGAQIELLDATLTYQDRTADAGRVEREAFLSVRADAAAAGEPADRELLQGAAEARAAVATLDAIAASRLGDHEGAARQLTEAEQVVRRSATELDDARLLATAEEMKALRATFLAEAKRQAKLARDAQRRANEGAPAAVKTPSASEPTPMPMPSMMPAADLGTVKSSHEHAVGAFQPR